MTDPTPDLAVLGRLEEIERRHFTGTIGTRCNCGYQLFPCDAIQLARAARVLVAEINARRGALAHHPECNARYGQPCACGLDALFAAAAPSREGE